ncbi:MAG: glutamine--tRNA ligase/YqeY domain fusion protein [Opitutales bacterium]|nr:glutamine--tRNA ligase/YqeY domain fusion protein [Opitutales bacterium]
MGNENTEIEEKREPRHFIQQAIDEDLASGRFKTVQTRFPPEPNGFLHIGHAKAICVSFEMAKEFGGGCNLRLDDTNPAKEDMKYVEAIRRDISWLGFEWAKECYASDYYEQLYEWAEKLIEDGNAFVCDLDAEEMRKLRGNLTEPGTNSPYRNRTVQENLELFRAMKEGQFEDGTKVLRAKIDMASPNLNLRDPVIYRIQRETHFRTGDKWCIYPMYDFAHGQSDSIEGVSHSLCSLEFEDHRPLYDWFCEKLEIFHPRQIEFARFNLSYAIMSKRKLLQLVEEKYVDGWDDPRMPTLSGLRRRGYTPESIRNFCTEIGISKRAQWIDISRLENCLRKDLENKAPRVMAVQKPLKLTIKNYPEGETEFLEAANHPSDESFGKRKVPFSKTLYIEQDDFMEDAPKKFFRLTVGREVRLRYAYYITCEEVVKDENGEIVELICTYDPETKGGTSADGRKVRGTIHWVSAEHALDAEIRLYDRLFTKEDPEPSNTQKKKGKTYLDNLNPESLVVLDKCKVEPSLGKADVRQRFQFERLGFYIRDSRAPDGKLVYNRSASLKDSWAKQQ